MSEDNRQLIGEIHANTRLLLQRTERIENQMADVQRTKADIVLVEKIEGALKKEVSSIDEKLTNHLNNIDEIIAFKTRPLSDELKATITDVGNLKNYAWKSAFIVGMALAMLQFFYNLFGDKIKEVFMG